jgi:outer membrane protein OmpA-like peptidoglycan-associated protein
MLLALVLCVSNLALGQGRKMPPFSFMEHSTVFADANRNYSNEGGFTQSDTLTDAIILSSLTKILATNPALVIQLTGHTAMNENAELGMQRAERIRTELVAAGIDAERLVVESRGHDEPILSQAVILSLPTEIEREIANQKNRRVTVSIIRKHEE